MKRIFQITMLLLLASIIFLECGDATSKTSSESVMTMPKKVETVKAKAIDYQEVVFASGKLSSREEVKLSFKTGGIIKKIHVREGQQVRKGQLLAELNLKEIRAQKQQARLGVQQAEITIANAELAVQRAERDYRNALGLYQDSVATYEQLNDAELQLKNAKNQLEAAIAGRNFNRQGQDVVNFNLRFSKIKAPANGTILKKLAEPNELVGPGNPVFLFGSKDNAKVIKVNITDSDIIFIKMGDEASVEFDAYPNHIFKGEVIEIGSMADPFTNTFEVEISLENEGRKLLSGFIGKVHILTKTGKALIEIPIDALVSADKNLGEIFIVKEGKAIKTSVEIYKIKNDKLLISNGLIGDEEVVIKGAGYLEQEDSVSQNRG